MDMILKRRERAARKSGKRGSKKARFGIMLTIAIFVIILAFLGNRIAPQDPLKTDFAHALEAPSHEHLLGTDNVGRDIFSRLIAGAVNSFSYSFIMVILVAVIGTTIGMIAGFFGGALDTVIMRITDILLAFPNTVFAIALVGVIGPGLMNTIIALGLIGWTRYARVARGLVSPLKYKEYILEARLGGAGTGKILLRYILPNILPQIAIMATTGVGGSILSLAGLSFLGLASQPPAPEWGYMLNEGRAYLQVAPWVIISPGIMILITVVIFNLLGDTLRDLWDPKEL